MHGLFDFVTEAWDKLTETAESLAQKAEQQTKVTAAQTLAIATQKVVPFVTGGVTSVVGAVAKPIIGTGSKILGNVFASPPKPVANAAAAVGEQVQYVYEGGTSAATDYLTTFPAVPMAKAATNYLDHPLTNILPK